MEQDFVTDKFVCNWNVYLCSNLANSLAKVTNQTEVLKKKTVGKNVLKRAFYQEGEIVVIRLRCLNHICTPHESLFNQICLQLLHP